VLYKIQTQLTNNGNDHANNAIGRQHLDSVQRQRLARAAIRLGPRSIEALLAHVLVALELGVGAPGAVVAAFVAVGEHLDLESVAAGGT